MLRGLVERKTQALHPKQAAPTELGSSLVLKTLRDHPWTPLREEAAPLGAEKEPLLEFALLVVSSVMEGLSDYDVTP